MSDEDKSKIVSEIRKNRKSGLKSGLISEQDQKIIDNQASSESEMIPDTISGSDVTSGLICEVCGKEFETESSFEAHKLRAHRIARSKPERERGEKTTASKVQPTSRPEISTEADMIRDFLKALGYQKTEAVIQLLDAYGYDVYSVYRALKEQGAGNSIIRPVIFWWSAKRNEPVPDEILEELKTEEWGYNRQRTGYSSWKRPRYEGESSISDLLTVIMADKRENTETIKALFQVVVNLLSNNRNRESEDPSLREEVREMKEENRELRQKYEDLLRQLQEEKAKKLEEELQTVKREVAELKSKPTNVELRKLDILDHRLSDLVDIGKIIVKSSLVEAPAKPPKRKESPSAELSIEELESLGVPYEIEGGE